MLGKEREWRRTGQKQKQLTAQSHGSIAKPNLQNRRAYFTDSSSDSPSDPSTVGHTGHDPVIEFPFRLGLGFELLVWVSIFFSTNNLALGLKRRRFCLATPSEYTSQSQSQSNFCVCGDEWAQYGMDLRQAILRRRRLSTAVEQEIWAFFPC